VAAAAHVPVVALTLEEAPYLAFMFIGVIAALVLLAISVLVEDTSIVYTAAATLGGHSVGRYAATRLIASPMIAGDVGNWFEPVGVLAVCAEAAVVVVAITALARRSRPAGDMRHGMAIAGGVTVPSQRDRVSSTR